MANAIVLAPALIALVLTIELGLRTIELGLGRTPANYRSLPRRTPYVACAFIAIVSLAVPVRVEIYWLILCLILLPAFLGIYSAMVRRHEETLGSRKRTV